MFDQPSPQLPAESVQAGGPGAVQPEGSPKLASLGSTPELYAQMVVYQSSSHDGLALLTVIDGL